MKGVGLDQAYLYPLPPQKKNKLKAKKIEKSETKEKS